MGGFALLDRGRYGIAVLIVAKRTRPIARRAAYKVYKIRHRARGVSVREIEIIRRLRSHKLPGRELKILETSITAA
jgi:hypothetical protein